jgi:putative heme-binding domain-containing protein
LRFLWISFAAASLYAQSSGTVADNATLPERNPFTSADDLAEGKRLFAARCSGCHGQSGEGGRGPALPAARSDRDLFRIVRMGISKTEMPSSPAQTDPEIWRIVAFVRQIAGSAPPEIFEGDAEIGKKVYLSQSCHVCHWIDGEGVVLGPELSRAGARTAAYLKESVRNPDADISKAYRGVSVTTASGARVRGVLMGEDERSVHLRDMNGKPRSFPKSELKEVQIESGSLMPAYTMPSTDLDNIVAYLKSHR